MAYVYPSAVHTVSDSFQDHVNRGSVNPGTDYTDAYGDTVVSVAAGTVTDASNDNGGGGGRTIHVDHDDGSGADYLHLSKISVSAGQWVSQGQTLGQSGASGYGSDWYYGAHLHISFRYNHSHGYSNNGNVDFDAIMRGQGGSTPTPPTPEGNEDMSNIIHRRDGSLALAASDGSFTVLTDMDQVNSLVAAGTVPSNQNSWVWLQDDLIWNKLSQVAGKRTTTNNPVPPPPPVADEASPWTVIVGLGLVIIALGLAVLLAYLVPASGASPQALDTALKVVFGAGAVLLGLGAKSGITWIRSRKVHDDEAQPVIYLPNLTAPPKNTD
jgi:murein DD-endopeptidase MepM/ murein hydrolase activator NlpD